MGDPLVSTYDDATVIIKLEQKTLISAWYGGPTDPCNFRLRAMTQKEIGSLVGDVYVEWVGFGFDLHPTNITKQRRNTLIGQNLTHIKQRGWGFDEAVHHPIPYSYYNGVDLALFIESGNLIKVRSNTCPYALDFFVDGWDTKFSFYAGEKYSGAMIGVCGDCNGVREDDYRSCPDDEHPNGEEIHGEDKFSDVAVRCKEGKHQGHHYTGGQKV